MSLPSPDCWLREITLCQKGCRSFEEDEMFMQSSGSRFGTVKQARPVLGVLLFTAVVFVFAGCEGGKQVAVPPPPPEVLVAEVAQQDVPIYFEWLGTTDGYVNAQIRPRVQGYLQSQHYRE